MKADRMWGSGQIRAASKQQHTAASLLRRLRKLGLARVPSAFEFCRKCNLSEKPSLADFLFLSLTGRRSDHWNQWGKHKRHDPRQSNRAHQIRRKESAAAAQERHRTGPRVWCVSRFDSLSCVASVYCKMPELTYKLHQLSFYVNVYLGISRYRCTYAYVSPGCTRVWALCFWRTRLGNVENIQRVTFRASLSVWGDPAPLIYENIRDLADSPVHLSLQ